MIPDPPADPAGPLAAGERVGPRYEIVRPLGRGGFGHTYLARDLEHDGMVALKTLHGRGADLKAYQLFEREAAVLLGLRHHGIPEFVASFRAPLAGIPAAVLVMEFVEGVSLDRMIAEQAVLAPVRVLDLLLELLGILDYLHTRVPPVLHRDIKPANVIIRPDGSPVLVDFGAVRNVFRAPGESGSTVVGTYGYMPYEQYMGQASAASDLYALGATALHLVTGRPPSDFMSDEGRVAVPAALPIGEPIRGVIARLLEPAPTRRYPSARAAREALLAGPSHRPGSEPSVSLARHVAATPVIMLGPAPRALTGETAALFARVAYSGWQLMEPTRRPEDDWGVMEVLSFLFFSVITAGVLPLVFFGVARQRRRRLRRFFRDGVPGTAVIVDFRQEDLAFGEKLTRVRFEFEADGRTHRGSDAILPVIADRWRPGESIDILYLPEREYDAVIVGGH